MRSESRRFGKENLIDKIKRNWQIKIGIEAMKIKMQFNQQKAFQKHFNRNLVVSKECSLSNCEHFSCSKETSRLERLGETLLGRHSQSSFVAKSLQPRNLIKRAVKVALKV